MNNNNGFVNNNFNNMNPQNMFLMQQLLLAMNNMNLQRNNGPQFNNNGMNTPNEYLINMINNMNKGNNLQNQNGGMNLNLMPFLVNNNKNNQEEISIVRTIRENTDKGQKIYKLKYSTSLVKNSKNRKYQK